MMFLKSRVSQWLTPSRLLTYLTLFLVGFGFIMVYSSSAMKAPYDRKVAMVKKNPELKDKMWMDNEYHNTYYLKRQLMFAGAGFLLLMLFYQKIRHDELKRYSWMILLFSIFMLILVFLPGIGRRSHGAARWIQLGPMTFQPSELAKLAVIIFMASYLEDNKRKITDLKNGLLPIGIIAAIPCALILSEPDLGSTVIIGAIVFAMCLIGRMKNSHLIAILIMGMIVFVLAIILSSYRKERWGLNEHVQQSLIAVGSGGLFGHGLGNGISKYHFLGEAHCDFIFSVICQEFGFIGGVALITIYLLWILQGIRIAMNAPTYFTALLASGVTMMIGLPVFINIFSALKIGPTKGLVLPFISYGGSSILVCLMATGVLLGIARDKEIIDQDGRMIISAEGN